MDNKRGSERTLINQLLKVNDRRSGTQLGNLVNLSSDGFMLISAVSIEPDSSAQLSLELPHAVDGKTAIELDATCVWCQRSSFSDDYGAGFRIDRLSPEDHRVLRSIFGAA